MRAHTAVSLGFLGAAALAAACSNDSVTFPRTGPVDRVELSPGAASIAESDTLRFRAIPRDSSGTIVPRTRAEWRSSQPNVATIDSLGFVRALMAGRSEITARVDTVVGRATVIVLPRANAAFVRIAAGAEHTCAVTGAGSVYCWGGNTFGQLGSGNTASSATPVRAAGIEAADVATGVRHTCVADPGSGAWCWGSNSAGQLGDESPGQKVHPAAVPSIAVERIIAIAAGSGHSCALAHDGVAFCWGSNTLGQLGRGTAAGVLGPLEVAGNHRFISIATGQAHACGVTIDGIVLCWGWNQFGQLGSESTGSCAHDGAPCSTSPQPIAGTLRFRAVTAGYGHTCALDESNAAWCWGTNEEGQLGDGTRAPSSVPVRVRGPALVQIDAGDRHVCGITEPGAAYCWGLNLNGQLGSSQPVSSPTPLPVAIEPLSRISAGTSHTCALTTAGRVRCWGDAADGRLGAGLRAQIR
ncbi:MAG TPA: Ig-like domain-containing protein [Longimicrobiales bacterium]|nr:Ig-like domain-containing protein [Longimicrobiales bacterium]